MHLLRGQMRLCKLLTEMIKLCNVAQRLVGVNVGRWRVENEDSTEEI
jgi:hypothetical protein